MILTLKSQKKGSMAPWGAGVIQMLWAESRINDAISFLTLWFTERAIFSNKESFK